MESFLKGANVNYFLPPLNVDIVFKFTILLTWVLRYDLHLQNKIIKSLDALTSFIWKSLEGDCTKDVFISSPILAQSAGAAEHTDCFSAEDQDSHFNECPVYDTKQSDHEVAMILELWWMQITPLLPLLPGSLWPGMVIRNRALSMA